MHLLHFVIRWYLFDGIKTTVEHKEGPFPELQDPEEAFKTELKHRPSGDFLGGAMTSVGAGC